MSGCSRSPLSDSGCGSLAHPSLDEVPKLVAEVIGMKKCGPDRRVDLVPEGEVLLQAVKDGLGRGEGGAFDQIPSRCENLGDLRGPFFHFSPCKAPVKVDINIQKGRRTGRSTLRRIVCTLQTNRCRNRLHQRCISQACLGTPKTRLLRIRTWLDVSTS